MQICIHVYMIVTGNNDLCTNLDNQRVYTFLLRNNTISFALTLLLFFRVQF